MLNKVIEDAIESEVQTRVNEKIDEILAIISKQYNIKLDRLIKDISSSPQVKNSGVCCGVLKNGQRCKVKTKGGYCKRHESQKPAKPSVSVVHVSESSTSNPFFAGLQLRNNDAG
jgi:hypothetical protein